MTALLLLLLIVHLTAGLLGYPRASLAALLAGLLVVSPALFLILLLLGGAAIYLTN